MKQDEIVVPVHTTVSTSRTNDRKELKDSLISYLDMQSQQLQKLWVCSCLDVHFLSVLILFVSCMMGFVGVTAIDI